MTKFDTLTNNRQQFLENLYKLIKSEFESPSEDIEERINTIAIDSSWGTGKSHFAEALEEYVKDKNDNNFNIDLIKFNAWENDYYEDPMQTLIGEINSQITLGIEVKEAAENIIKNSGKVILKVITSILSKKVGVSDEDISAIKDIFTGVNESSLEDYKKYKEMVKNFKTCLEQKDIVDGKTRNKIIIVDELDRCRPDFAIETLETIKHIFNVRGIVFIFMINKKLLNSSVKQLYGNINDDEEYFKKFFNLEFSLPNINYQNYLNIEYENLNLQYLSQDFDLNKYGKFVFLNVISSLNTNISTRQQKLLLRKFAILQRTFSLAESSNVDFLCLISLYLLYRDNNNDSSISFSKWITFVINNKAVDDHLDEYNIDKILRRLSIVFSWFIKTSKVYPQRTSGTKTLGNNIISSIYFETVETRDYLAVFLPGLNTDNLDTAKDEIERFILKKCSFINTME